MSNLLDGRSVAKLILADTKKEVEALNKRFGDSIKLATILVGDDGPSQIYVQRKIKMCAKLGMESMYIPMSSDCSQKDVLDKIASLNADTSVHGILLQLPLPRHMDSYECLESIDPIKDVDGFHSKNVGLLNLGKTYLAPCTPTGIMALLDHYKVNLKGKNCVVIGRSHVVGRPMAAMLTQKDATVTLCHSKTVDLKSLCLRADLIVSAVGKSMTLPADWVSSHTVIVDVGINRNVDGTLSGDVDFKGLLSKAELITPVPGGVGPLTIAMLMKNTVKAYRCQKEREKELTNSRRS